MQNEMVKYYFSCESEYLATLCGDCELKVNIVYVHICPNSFIIFSLEMQTQYFPKH